MGLSQKIITWKMKGAGQDVGRSCFLVSMNGKNILLDCGLHMGFQDDRKFPDFSFILRDQPLDEFLNCVIISHFHLDHCGSLPYFSEVVGYKGPIYMTYPTKAICPLLLEDFRRISADKKNDFVMFTDEQIARCMKKVRAVNLHQVVQVEEDLEIKAYYAGHVLGAAMFLIKSGDLSVLYTGDYNMTPDRHLSSAWVDRCRPTLIISESTYATTIRDSKRAREREFLDKVHKALDEGGKVLIPVFALGRAQELCILLESYWERMNLDYPIYFSTGMAEKATQYYKLFISWTNEIIRDAFVDRNMFDFKHISPLQNNTEERPGPMVIFATPGMLHAGQSLNIFKKLAPDPKNMIIIPGYCVSGTIGYKILNGAKQLEYDGDKKLDVKLRVEYLSFSAHADAKGIMRLISQCSPQNVMLVHGEKEKMEYLSSKITKELKLPCWMPANGEVAIISSKHMLKGRADPCFLLDSFHLQEEDLVNLKKPILRYCGLTMKDNDLTLMDSKQLLKEAGQTVHTLKFVQTLSFQSACPSDELFSKIRTRIIDLLRGWNINENYLQSSEDGFNILEHINIILKHRQSNGTKEESQIEAPTASARRDDNKTVRTTVPDNQLADISIDLSFSYDMEHIASNIHECLNKLVRDIAN